MPSVILSDNGVSSGSAGLKSTAASDGALALQTTTAGGSATTAALIDTSQNVLVGMSSYGVTNAGVSLSPAASSSFYVAGGTAVTIGRGVSNGTAVQFNRSGTNVGTIDVATTGLTMTGTNGITFTAAQSASSDANTLDDYEEGTFTPTFGAGSGSFTTLTYNIQAGRYTKIGNMVYFIVALQVATITVGTAASYLYVGSLPFTSGSFAYNEAPATVGECSNWSTQRPTVGYVDNGSTNVILEYATSTGATLILPSNLQANTYMQVSGFYSVT